MQRRGAARSPGAAADLPASQPSVRLACGGTPLMPWTPPPGGVDEEHRNRPAIGRGVRVPADDGAEQELAHVLDAAVDVAADVVGVVRLHRARAVHGSGQDEVPEARRIPLDLRLDRLGRVPGPAVGDVAVRPGDVLAARARATGRRWSAGRAARTGAPRPGRGGRRPRPRRPRASSRPGGPCRPARSAGRARGSGRRAPSRACGRPGRTGSPPAGVGSRPAGGRPPPRAPAAA